MLRYLDVFGDSVFNVFVSFFVIFVCQTFIRYSVNMSPEVNIIHGMQFPLIRDG